MRRGESAGYLARLPDGYTRCSCHYDQAPLLLVNAAGFNPIEHDSDYQALLGQIRRPDHGRRYFNPSPLAIH